MRMKIALIVIFAVYLSGCSFPRVMKASYSSEIDPDSSFTFDKSIAVFVSEQGNTLETKYYVDQVVVALKQRGFRNVYSYRNVNEAGHPIDLAMVIDVDRKSSSYQYNGANYGLVDSGTSTSNCTGYGNSVNCTHNKQTAFGVTGYSTKTGYLTAHYFTINWFNVSNWQKIMFTFGSSYEERCSDRAVYEFLISETIKRLDFQKPNNYDYSVKMPETYTCNY